VRGHDVVAETTVAGGRTVIPARVRRELDVEDGDRLRWQVDENRLRVTVIRERERTFDGFEGYGGETITEASLEHDGWGVE